MKEVIFLFAVVMFTNVFAAEHEVEATDTQSIDGGPTTQLIESTTVAPPIKENTMLDTSTTLKKQGPSTGAVIRFSDNIQIYSLPLSYGINESFKIGASIPYIIKELKGTYGGENLKNRGLGDISIYGTFYYIWKEKIRFTSTLTVKLPTGTEESFEGGKERLPLGTGSYDFIISEYAVIKSSNIDWLRYTAGISYRKNTKGEYTEKATLGLFEDNYTFTNQNGNILTLSAGSIFFTPFEKLLAYTRFTYTHISRGEGGYTDPYKTVNTNKEKHDGLTTFDITPGIKYKFTKALAARFGITVPISTSYDDAVTDKKDRETVIDFGIDYVF